MSTWWYLSETRDNVKACCLKVTADPLSRDSVAVREAEKDPHANRPFCCTSRHTQQVPFGPTGQILVALEELRQPCSCSSTSPPTPRGPGGEPAVPAGQNVSLRPR